MKKFKHLILIGFILVAIPVSAKQLWEYGSFSERANMAVSQGIVDEKSAYKGTYEQNAELLKNITLNDLLGFAPSTGYYETLTTFISKTASTINVSSTDDQDGFELPLSTSNKGYFNLEPGTAREERVVCTGVSGDAFTGCTRGLVASSATNETASTTLQYTHSAGSIIIMTNIAQFFGNYVNIWDAQTVAGIKTFSSYPLIETYVAPTANEQFAPKKYVDDVISSGASDATETAKGISELATAAEAALGTSSGSAARLVLPASIASSSNDVAGAKVVVSEADGYINQNRLDLSEDFAFSGDNTFTGDNTYAGIATTSGQSIFTATSTYSGVLPTSDINPSNDDDLVRKGYLGWDLGANGTNDYFTVQIPCIEDVMTIDNVTFTEEGGFCTVEGIAANWNIETRYLMGKGSESNLQYDDTGIVSMQVRLRAVNGVTGNRRWGFGHPAGFDDIIHDDLTQKSVQFGAIGTELVALAINGTANTVMPITGYTVTDWNLYEIEWDLTNDTAKFYVNGTLEITLSTTTPTTADDVSWGTGGTADTEDSDVSNIMYRMEL